MDARTTPTLSERLATLSDDQKAVLILLAKDYRDYEVIKELQWQNERGWSVITSLFDHFAVDKVKYEAGLESLMNIGRENGFLTMPLPEREAAASGDEVIEETAPEAKQKRKNPETGEMPDLKATVKKVFNLNNDQRDLLHFYASSIRGDDASADKAKELGVTTATIYNRMNRIYEKLEVPFGRGRKKFIRKVVEEFERQKRQLRDGASKPPAQVKNEVAESDEVPVPTAAVSQEVVVREPAHEVVTNGSSASSHQPPALAGQGIGVVIPLPVDVTNVDVISGCFDGKTPQPALKEAIQSRKRAGFKPGFLVLTSTPDPSVSLAQFVFFEHGDSSE